MGAPLQLAGKTFSRLTVIEPTKERDSQGLIVWLCKCSCGNTVKISGRSIARGKTKSCGCLQIEAIKETSKLSITHGRSKDGVYWVWRGMIKRCHSKTNKGYKKYGGRGISVCERWHKFENFLSDMGDPAGNLSIDRIDVNGDYEPNNCRWATSEVQGNNRRTNIVITHNGESLTIAQWSRKTGINRQTLYWRAKQNWHPEKMLNQ